jgi:D-tyrosyl-tRNA(Tyr) deacylase
MKAVLQRVDSARVEVGGQAAAAIGRGILVLLGVEKGDGPEQADWMARKVAEIRIFDDDDGQMNRGLADAGGEVLAVSQFTLAASAEKGRRPSFDRAARPEDARPLYERFVEALRGRGVRVQTGVFRERMKVSLVNDGPVTILLETRGTGARSDEESEGEKGGKGEGGTQ